MLVVAASGKLASNELAKLTSFVGLGFSTGSSLVKRIYRAIITGLSLGRVLYAFKLNPLDSTDSN